MKTVLILQAFGLGDCIFAQGIAHHFLKKGYPVVWPVRDKYFVGLTRAYPKINWVPDSLCRPELFDVKEKIDLGGGIRVAPIRWSDTYMKVPYAKVMRAKYDMYELDWREWKDAAGWKRDMEKENELFNYLGLGDRKKYNLVNGRYGNHGVKELEIHPKNGHAVIEMKEIDGYSLFDWGLVLQNADEIHTVSTSLLYILEVMNLRQPLHLYRRPNEKDFSFVEYLFTKPYILHQ